MATVQRKRLEAWENELEERGLLATVRAACRKRAITLRELFARRATRSVVACRRDLARELRSQNKSQQEIGWTLRLKPHQVAYCLKYDLENDSPQGASS